MQESFSRKKKIKKDPSGQWSPFLSSIYNSWSWSISCSSIWTTMEPQFVRHVAFGLVIWATMLLSRSTCLRSCSFPAIFNFGDSNSDTGGLSAAFGQAPYPNGETFFRTPSGRYSDGRLIIDFIGISPTSISSSSNFAFHYVSGFSSQTFIWKHYNQSCRSVVEYNSVKL